MYQISVKLHLGKKSRIMYWFLRNLKWYFISSHHYFGKFMHFIKYVSWMTIKNFSARGKHKNFMIRLQVWHLLHYTLYNTILRIARNLLETRENIKIESHSFYHVIGDKFSWGSSKKKKSKMADFQNGRFSQSPIL